MKKTLYFLSILFVAVIFASCNKNTPEAVAKEWLNDYYHLEYDDAKKLSTEETKAMLNDTQGFSNSLADSVKQNAKKVSITIKEVKIDGDKATVKFVASNEPDHEQPALKLVKQNEKWLVMWTKDDMKPLEDKANMAQPATPEVSITPGPPPAADANMSPDTTKQQ